MLRTYGAADSIPNCRGETAARLKRKPRSRAEEGVPAVYHGKTEAQLNPSKCLVM